MSHNKFLDYYNSENQNENRDVNIPEVQDAAKALLIDMHNKKYSWLLTKINNHIKRWKMQDLMNVNDELTKISTNEAYATFYAKPSTKQNQSEKCQTNYLAQRGIIVKKLPASKNNAWRIVMKTGKLVRAQKIEGEHTHSFDFLHEGEKFTDYIMAKVTTTQGGGQTQQRQEMIDAIKYMQLYIKKHPDNNIRFVLLLDGDSYDNGGIDVFKQYESDRIIITNSDSYDPRV